MKKEIEEFFDDTSPVEMEKCVNDAVDDENKHNLFEENETKLNYEDEDSTEIEGEEENVTTDSESSTFAEMDDKLNEICEGEEMNGERGGKDVA